MIAALIDWSLRNRLIVIVASLVLVAAGLYSMSRIDIDAFPDTTPVMVQVNAVAAALGPAEIEQQITIPIERGLSGLSRLIDVRSVSKFGFCQVNLIFDDSTDIFRARQLVAERLASVQLPQGVARPELGPVSTGLGEVFHYIVSSRTRSLTDLTTIHDWQIRPRLLGVPGVAEINTWGGMRRRFEVVVEPDRLLAFELTLDELSQALRENNLTVGGGNVSQAGEQHVVSGISLTQSLDDIGQIVLKAADGVPIRVRDVAEVREGHEIRRGGVTANGIGEVVHGLGFMSVGENAHRVTRALSQKLGEIGRSLPEGVDIKIVYERTELVDKVIATVRTNLLEGALLVIAVLFVFLGNLRAGLIVALAIPLSLLCAFSLMLQVGISASLLSLGALDFGLVVDSSVISVENSVRKLGQAGARSRLEVVRDAALEVRGPTALGELIIMIVYAPILMLEGIEGKLFRPMALTVIFALAGSLILSVTLIPALSSLLLPRKTHEREGIIVRIAQALLQPLVRFALHFRAATLLLALTTLVLAAGLAMRLGAEFVPRLSEMAITFNAVRLSGVSLEESLRYGTQIEKKILEAFPDEVRDVWSRTGSAAVATDPMGLEVTDVFITLQPRERWTRASNQSDLVKRLDEELSDLPGMNLAFSQPIEMRMNEMISGIRSDVGIRIYGEDLEQLRVLAEQVRSVLAEVPGAADVSVEQLTGLPTVQIKIDSQAIARYGVSAAHVLEIVEALGGISAGEIRDGERRFGLAIRLPEAYRRNPDSLARVLVPSSSGQRVPLTQLAELLHGDGPATIHRESGERRIVVQCNVRGRDLGSFVQEAGRRVAAAVELPAAYHLDFGGQYEHLIRSSRRLAIVVPTALAAILFLLYLSTRSVADTLIIFSGAPLAAVGGILALWLRGMPFTIPAAVGFIAVSGVSVLNGLVLVSTIRQRIAAGAGVDEAIEQTRKIRVRPILMTALVAALGFLPMALSSGVGAEVQRPLATVVIGGVISDNLLTFMVLPALFSLVHRREATASIAASAALT